MNSSASPKNGPLLVHGVERCPPASPIRGCASARRREAASLELGVGSCGSGCGVGRLWMIEQGAFDGHGVLVEKGCEIAGLLPMAPARKA